MDESGVIKVFKTCGENKISAQSKQCNDERDAQNEQRESGLPPTLFPAISLAQNKYCNRANADEASLLREERGKGAATACADETRDRSFVEKNKNCCGNCNRAEHPVAAVKP